MATTELRLWVPEWVHRHMRARARMMSVGPLRIYVEPEDLACFYLAAGLYLKEQGPDGSCQGLDPWWGIDHWPTRFELPSASVVAAESADHLPEQFGALRKSLAAKIRILKSNIQHLDSPVEDTYDEAAGDVDMGDVRDCESERWRSHLRKRAMEQLEQAEAALVAVEHTETLLYEAEVLTDTTKSAE